MWIIIASSRSISEPEHSSRVSKDSLTFSLAEQLEHLLLGIKQQERESCCRPQCAGGECCALHDSTTMFLHCHARPKEASDQCTAGTGAANSENNPEANSFDLPKPCNPAVVAARPHLLLLLRFYDFFDFRISNTLIIV